MHVIIYVPMYRHAYMHQHVPEFFNRTKDVHVCMCRHAEIFTFPELQQDLGFASMCVCVYVCWWRYSCILGICNVRFTCVLLLVLMCVKCLYGVCMCTCIHMHVTLLQDVFREYVCKYVYNYVSKYEFLSIYVLCEYTFHKDKQWKIIPSSKKKRCIQNLYLYLHMYVSKCLRT
jgi:hypothetical protein